MDIIEGLMREIQGTYYSPEMINGNLSERIYIYRNSIGKKQLEKFDINIYAYYSLGAQAPSGPEGSPFKLVLILPIPLRKHLNIFPRTVFDKLFIRRKRSQSFDTEYKIDGAKREVDKLYRAETLLDKIRNRKLYISSRIEGNKTFISLRPIESVTEVTHLKELYEIMLLLGYVLTA